MTVPHAVAGAGAHAYRNAGRGWARDAALAYVPLAAHLLDRCPVALDGRVALDAGAGTGAAGDLLTAAGAEVIAVDLTEDMLRHGACRACVVGDITALPLRDGAVEITVAAFVLNHLTSPVAGLRELRRVTAADGVVLASTFAASRAAAKSGIDAVLLTYGWAPPSWYDELHRRATSIDSAGRLADAARAAGFERVDVDEVEVDLGLDDPADVVRSRLGMPQISCFVDTLSEPRRSELVTRAVQALADAGEHYRPRVVELVAR